MELAHKSTLIAFEGIDGAGKTTQVGLLCDFFSRCNEDFVRSKEPTDGVWGSKIRQSATNGRLSADEELRCFVEDRKEHVRDLILPALQSGKTVVLDRYFYSTVAYQGDGADEILASQMAIAPVPDIVILIDTPPEVGIARIRNGRGEQPNAFEQIGELRKIREAFLRLANSQKNFMLVDGTQSIETIRKEIVTKLLEGVLKERHCAKGYGCDDPSQLVRNI